MQIADRWAMLSYRFRTGENVFRHYWLATSLKASNNLVVRTARTAQDCRGELLGQNKPLNENGER